MKKPDLFKKVYLFILTERERENMSMSGGGAEKRERERERERESQAGSTFSTEPNAGFNPMNHELMT